MLHLVMGHNHKVLFIYSLMLGKAFTSPEGHPFAGAEPKWVRERAYNIGTSEVCWKPPPTHFLLCPDTSPQNLFLPGLLEEILNVIGDEFMSKIVMESSFKSNILQVHFRIWYFLQAEIIPELTLMPSIRIVSFSCSVLSIFLCIIKIIHFYRWFHGFKKIFIYYRQFISCIKTTFFSQLLWCSYPQQVPIWMDFRSVGCIISLSRMGILAVCKNRCSPFIARFKLVRQRGSVLSLDSVQQV